MKRFLKAWLTVIVVLFGAALFVAVVAASVLGPVMIGQKYGAAWGVIAGVAMLATWLAPVFMYEEGEFVGW